MLKDQLYLMKPNFMNAGLGPFYCGDSVSVEGLLGFFPQLRDKVDVNYIDFPRPRQALVDTIGENQQSIPVLILAVDAPEVPEVEVKTANGRRFINDEKGIREYLSILNALPRSG
jgi:hypothetical protein